MNNQRLIRVVEDLASAMVACVGDVMLDHFIYGGVSRISPEAPIPVLRIDRHQSILGGAGNVARNLSALGCEVRSFSATGDDVEAGKIAELLAALPRCHAHLEREPGRQTPVKTRYVAQGQQLLRADHETTEGIGPAAMEKLLGAFEAALPACSVVLLSDYAKGMLNGPRAGEFIRRARAAGKPVVVDPKGSDFTRYKGATVVKPNLKELAEATGLPVAGDHAQEAAARKLLHDTGAEWLLVTRGAAGMVLVSAAGAVERFPSLAREVFDVSGAGDTVAAVLAAALGSGAGMAEAVEIANIAAGVVVGKTGTAVVDGTEIVHAAQQRAGVAAADKILHRAEAAELAQRWARMGLRTGFVGGCFDLLHPGHLALFEAARAQCDRLLAGVCAGRAAGAPVRSQMARAQVLASLGSIDGVVLFEEEAREELLLALRPDLLAAGRAGGDGGLRGAELVGSWGGQVLVVDRLVEWD